jgi:hypothetical protein
MPKLGAGACRVGQLGRLPRGRGAACLGVGRRGVVLAIESGPAGGPEPGAWLRRGAVRLWVLGVAVRCGR